LRVRRWERVVLAVSQREQFGRVKSVIWQCRALASRRRVGCICFVRCRSPVCVKLVNGLFETM